MGAGGEKSRAPADCRGWLDVSGKEVGPQCAELEVMAMVFREALPVLRQREELSTRGGLEM